jgi:hypothetical protein
MFILIPIPMGIRIRKTPPPRQEGMSALISSSYSTLEVGNEKPDEIHPATLLPPPPKDLLSIGFLLSQLNPSTFAPFAGRLTSLSALTVQY